MGNLKKYCMFVVSNAKRQIKHLVVGAFFYAYYSAYAVNIQGYQTPLTDCFTTLYCDCLLAKTEGDSLSLFNNFNFIRKMPKDNEITSNTKYSNVVSTLNSATTVSQKVVKYHKQAFFKTIKNFFDFAEPSSFIEANNDLLNNFFKTALNEEENYNSNHIKDIVFMIGFQNKFIAQLKENWNVLLKINTTEIEECLTEKETA